jgi:hypothetical protein
MVKIKIIYILEQDHTQQFRGWLDMYTTMRSEAKTSLLSLSSSSVTFNLAI